MQIIKRNVMVIFFLPLESISEKAPSIFPYRVLGFTYSYCLAMYV
jgi:hypothetical protein